MRMAVFIFFVAICIGTSAMTQSGVRDSADVVKIQVIPAMQDVAPGSDLPVAIVLEISPGWHIWTNDRLGKDDAANGIAQFDGAVFTSIQASNAWDVVRAASAVQAEWLTTKPNDPFIHVRAQWPEFHPVKADVGDGIQTYPVFEGEAVIFVPFSIAPNAPLGPQTVVFKIEFQACTATTCVAPSTVEVSMQVQVKAGTASSAPPAVFSRFDAEIFSQIHSGNAPSAIIQFDFFGYSFSVDPNGGGFFLVLFIAALGGLLLNFTPCVLPVIPLKIMGLSRIAGNRKRCLILGAALSIGVIVFWICLGLAVALISGFSTASQLFQYPLFTVTVGLIIALMAVGMCGFFSIQLPQSIAGIDFRHDTIVGSIGFGVMTAVLSTPCTAPLMGAAAAWAATQNPFVVFFVFGSIGFGMALPYFILSAFPKLVGHVPKSGPASDVVKQTMGLLLLAAAAYFVGAGMAGFLVSPPNPPTNDYWWIVSALGTIAGLWLCWRTLKLTKSAKFRCIFGSLGVAIALISATIGFQFTDDGKINWVFYTPARLENVLKSGDAVMIDFTAEWCLNCKTLEKTVLESSAVLARLNAGGIQSVKVDLTGNNVEGRALLKKYDRVTIPLLVILTADGQEIFKSDAYTPSEVVNAINNATSQKP
ncbi:MAG: thioredoxin family protein [Planctomycetota bacterium]|nr:thioredoxin family protein [Planctomycetota bacterium]